MSEKWTKWDNNTPPLEGAVMTRRGWEIPLKGTDPAKGLTELVIAVREGSIKAGAADIIAVRFGAADYQPGAPLTVEIVFNEPVDVEAGAEITLVSTQPGYPEIVLVAAEQTAVGVVVFEGVVPDQGGVITLGAQTVDGTVNDADGEDETNLAITAEVAEGAGERLVLANPAVATLVEFGDIAMGPMPGWEYPSGGQAVFFVTLDYTVNVPMGAKITVTTTGESGSFEAVKAGMWMGEVHIFLGNIPDEGEATLSIEPQVIDGEVTHPVTGQVMEVEIPEAAVADATAAVVVY